MAVSNIPDLTNISERTQLFNRQFENQIAYKVSEVDAVIGYFLKRGFDQVAAINTASVLLEQASIDKIPVYKLIDTLKGVNDVQLSNIVAQILNFNRPKTSALGFKDETIPAQLFDQRNIVI